jgi:hypothetical protein
MPQLKTIGGCRLATGGLHFGHLHGCFLPRASGVRPSNYVFVISDCVSGGKPGRATLRRMLLDVYACEPYVGGLRVVRESSIRPYLRPLLEKMTFHLTARSLMQVHPQRARIFLPGSADTVNDLMFPIHQAAFLAGLLGSTVFMNDDNLDLVRFARKIITRSIPNFQKGALPVIHTGPAPRLLGAKGLRMAKANQNTLEVFSPTENIKRYFTRAIRRSEMSVRAGLMPNNDRLSFHYLRIFSSSENAQSLITHLRNGSVQTEEIIEAVVTGVEELLTPARALRDQLVTDLSAVESRCELETNSVIEEITASMAEWELS